MQRQLLPLLLLTTPKQALSVLMSPILDISTVIVVVADGSVAPTTVGVVFVVVVVTVPLVETIFVFVFVVRVSSATQTH